MKHLIVWGLFTSFLFLNACGHNDRIIAPETEGLWSYTSYDSKGRVIVEGWFDIQLSDSVSFNGSWHFIKIGNPQNTGPQVGQGQHNGSFFSTDSIWLELNPQNRDNNLQLLGHLQDNTIRGSWSWISFSGVSAQGTFVARK